MAGLLSLPLGLVGMAQNVSASRKGFTQDRGAGIEFLLLAGAAGLVFMLGLAVRHRHQWWARPLVIAAVASAAVAVLGAIAAGVPGLELGMIGIAVAWGLLVIGALVAGELPRPPFVLILLGAPLDGSRLQQVIGTLLSLVGYVWLAGAMWGEPLPERTPFEGSDVGSPLPA